MDACGKVAFVLIAATALAHSAPPQPTDPHYDHQHQSYNASHSPASVSIGGTCRSDTDCPRSYCMNDPTKSSPYTCHTPEVSITPFFSPEYSSATLVSFLQSAKHTIDIATPGFSSWSGCTPWTDNTTGCVQACTPEKQREEAFPIFAVLLNAVHAGIRIRILTNNYEEPDCTGSISPLPFLALNGVHVAYYTSTTFMHAKYIAVDGIKISITSINFSRTSFTRNREAGALIGGPGAAPILSFTSSIFEADWAQAEPLNPQPSEWSSTELATITNVTALAVVLPEPSKTWAAYYNPPNPAPITVAAGSSMVVAASPDYASRTLMSSIQKAVSKLDVMIYQITGDDIADELIRLARRGVAVRLLVSSSIYGAADCAAANAIYTRIVAASSSILIYKTTRHYTYSHQKFWIVDGSEVGWSTGNWGPTDFPASSAQPQPVVYPTYGKPGWQKLNRDFSMYVKDSQVAAAFQAVFEGDLDLGRSFPSPVYPWTDKYRVACGNG